MDSTGPKMQVQRAVAAAVTNVRRLNWRRGLFRVWLLGTLTWCVLVFVGAHVADKLQYAYQYHANYPKLELQAQKAAARSRTSWEQVGGEANPYDSIVTRMAAQPAPRAKQLPVPGSTHTVVVKPRPPDWSWVPTMVLPPTIGVLLALGAVWLLIQTGRWVWRGFAA